MKEYNEVYGYLPQEVINHLSENDRRLAFVSWLQQKPSPGGRLITQAVIEKLGEEFIEFLTLRVAAESNMIDDAPLTKETLVDEINMTLEEFATGTNMLCVWVNDFLDEKGKTNPETGKFRVTPENEKTVQGKPVRDPRTGRFIKRNN